MRKVKMIASGRVQGVGFRWSVQFLAVEIGDIYAEFGIMMMELSPF